MTLDINWLSDSNKIIPTQLFYRFFGDFDKNPCVGEKLI